MSDYVDEAFLSFPGRGTEWRDYVGSIVTGTATRMECAVECIQVGRVNLLFVPGRFQSSKLMRLQNR